jgi:O-phosphoseryl-tRNA(Cys) synthetase
MGLIISYYFAKDKTIGNEDPSYETRKKITSSLLNLGFNELIHYLMKQHFWIMKSN